MTRPTAPRPSLFNSFWMGGFESACHVLRSGARLDMLEATQHDRFINQDYEELAGVGIQTVRDTIRWHLVEPAEGRFDFSSVDPYLRAARRHDVQVVWDLLHYGWPPEVDVFGPEFVTRFARFAGRAARHVREHSDAVPFYTPINEISFLSWAAGEVGFFYPFGRKRGTELKRQLVRAWIAAVDAIREVDPRARFVCVDPVIHVVSPQGRRDARAAAMATRASQWAGWDSIVGTHEPELGGRADYLDIIGVNFYYDNQWEEPGGRRLDWRPASRDPRWMPLNALLQEAYGRYRRPILIGETSHIGDGRAEWIREVTDEVSVAVRAGVPLEGICLYPLIDRFEWENPGHWHNSGLWDVIRRPDGALRRVLNAQYAAELRRCQVKLAALGYGSVERREAMIW